VQNKLAVHNAHVVWRDCVLPRQQELPRVLTVAHCHSDALLHTVVANVVADELRLLSPFVLFAELLPYRDVHVASRRLHLLQLHHESAFFNHHRGDMGSERHAGACHINVRAVRQLHTHAFAAVDDLVRGYNCMVHNLFIVGVGLAKLTRLTRRTNDVNRIACDLDYSAPHVRLRRQQLHLVPPVLHHHAKDVRSKLHPGTRNPHFPAVAQLHGYLVALHRIRNNLCIVKSNTATAILPAHSARLARCSHMRHAVEQGPRHLHGRAQRQQPQQLPAGVV
jgi:hypothetical protein